MKINAENKKTIEQFQEWFNGLSNTDQHLVQLTLSRIYAEGNVIFNNQDGLQTFFDNAMFKFCYELKTSHSPFARTKTKALASFLPLFYKASHVNNINFEQRLKKGDMTMMLSYLPEVPELFKSRVLYLSFDVKSPTTSYIIVRNTLDRKAPEYKSFYLNPSDLVTYCIHHSGNTNEAIAQENEAGLFLTSILGNEKSNNHYMLKRKKDNLPILEELLVPITTEATAIGKEKHTIAETKK